MGGWQEGRGTRKTRSRHRSGSEEPLVVGNFLLNNYDQNLKNNIILSYAYRRKALFLPQIPCIDSRHKILIRFNYWIKLIYI